MNTDLILTALEDYRRWWDEDGENDKGLREEIDAAIEAVKEINPYDDDFRITSLQKDDLCGHFADPKTGKVPRRIEKRIAALTDDDMRWLARKLADAFCGCCYWKALDAAFEALTEKEATT